MTHRERLGSLLVAVPVLILALVLGSRLSDERSAVWPYAALAVAATAYEAWNGPLRQLDPRRWRAALTAGYWLGTGAIGVFGAVTLQFAQDRWYGITLDVILIFLSAVSVGDGARRLVEVVGRPGKLPVGNPGG